MPDDLSQCGKRGQYLGVAIAEVNEVVRQLDFLSTVFNAPINVKPEGGDPGHMWGI